eukprot:XP_024464329.1 aluminum-activated malate transporter 2 [Populus trichocarpa]
MEVGYGSGDKTGFFTQGRRSLKALTVQFKVKTVELARNIKKLGQDDPRRVIHSLKVGLALTLVSMFYYCQPLYSNFDETAIWAIMTVVVVFEFSVGATLGKGLNRGMATLMAGGLGAGAHHLANLSGHIGEPILLGFFVFLQATISTFLRFLPKIKSRYDYGMLIFILTFSMISTDYNSSAFVGSSQLLTNSPMDDANFKGQIRRTKSTVRRSHRVTISSSSSENDMSLGANQEEAPAPSTDAASSSTVS